MSRNLLIDRYYIYLKHYYKIIEMITDQLATPKASCQIIIWDRVGVLPFRFSPHQN